MLPTVNRLSKSREIERVVKTGRSFGTPLLGVRAALGGGPATRIAVVAGLAVHKRAVRRNRVKRLVREALRKNIEHIRPGLDIVISCRARAVGKNYQDIADALAFAFEKLGMLRG